MSTWEPSIPAERRRRRRRPMKSSTSCRTETSKPRSSSSPSISPARTKRVWMLSRASRPTQRLSRLAAGSNSAPAGEPSLAVQPGRGQRLLRREVDLPAHRSLAAKNEKAGESGVHFHPGVASLSTQAERDDEGVLSERERLRLRVVIVECLEPLPESPGEPF